MTLTQFIDRVKHTLIPTVDQIAELRNKDTLKFDIFAGITVALVLVPQSMAYAQLAGLPAQAGLYAAFLPPMIAAIFGCSRQLSTGPVAVVSIMTAAALEPIISGNAANLLIFAGILAIMVGIIKLLLGFFRLGVLVDFLSHPVVVGFTNAGAIIIGTSQLNKLFGVEAEKGEKHYQTVLNMFDAITNNIHWLTVMMSILALIIIFGVKKFKPTWPGVLIAVIITTLVSYFADYEQKGGKIIGEIKEGLPAFSVPTFSWEITFQLLSAAIFIALIGFMEAISVAKAIATKTRQRIDANQELVGQGLANISSGLFGGYPVAGSFSRSAVNTDSGAITGFSSIVASIVVGITLLFLTPLLFHLPQATLAVIIIAAVVGLFKIEPIIHAWKAEKHDGIVGVVTFLATLYMAPHFDKGILLGVFLGMALFIYRTMRPRFAVLGRYHDQTLRDMAVHPEMEKCDEIKIVRFDMSLYYANAGYFETKMIKLIADNPKMKVVILDAEGINMIDSTGEMILLQLIDRLKETNVNFLIARMKRQFMESLRKSGDLQIIGDDHFFARMTYALEYAWWSLDCQHCKNSSGEGENTCSLKVDSAKRHYARRRKASGSKVIENKIKKYEA